MVKTKSGGLEVPQIRKMSEEQTFTSYSFNPDSNSIHGEKGISYQTNEAAMKYTNLDKSNRKQEKSKLKRSNRRRVEKVRNFPSSDMESDTGSDGLAVNSEGSGRSGDWGPPQLRRKPKPHRKRSEARISLTDSGISLSKTDLESLSGLSNTHLTPEYRHLNRYEMTVHTTYTHLPSSQEHKTSTVDSSLEQNITAKGLPNFNSISPIPKRLSVNDLRSTESTNAHPNALQIAETENTILEQCLINEKLVNEENASKTAVDSRFPLPDHLNYPICRYRIKSESDNRLHPLKKLKDGWRKLRTRKLFNDKQDSCADTDCYPEFYPQYVPPTAAKDEDDNEAILSRLSRNPNERKNFAKRIFGRLGSKSYSVRLEESSRARPRMPRSGSTLSVPDALQDMWNKVHSDEVDLPYKQTSSHKSLHKVSSMPSIHTNLQRENLSKENYFSQLATANPEKQRHNSDKVTNNEILDSLSTMHITQEKCNTDKKVCFNDNTTHYYDDFRCSRNEASDKNDSLVRSSSCHELYNRNNRNQKGNYVVPQQQMYYSPTATCTCCIPGQHMQFMPFYPYPNYVYPVTPYGGYPPMEYVPNFYPVNAVPNYYPRNGEHGYPVMNGVSVPVDNVVAPLDVKIEHDKKAEKRKISEIVFDTFV